MKKFMRPLMTALFLFGTSQTASAAGLISTSCQKNLGDGRVLVEDASVLPSEDATFSVRQFEQAESDGSWATGRCTIEITGPIPRPLDTQKVCRGRASIGGPFDQATYNDCVANERRLRPSVEARWPAAAPALRAKCLKFMGDSYASLDGCLLEAAR